MSEPTGKAGAALKICVCFSGQPRTIEDTGFNIRNTLFNAHHEYTILYCTWVGEDTTSFKWHFPNAKIQYIEQPTIDSEIYREWLNSIGRSDRAAAFYNDFLMMYCVRKTAEYASTLGSFDLCMRIRPDAIYNMNITNIYDTVKRNTIVVSPCPAFAGTCGLFWLGRFEECLKLMMEHLYVVAHIDNLYGSTGRFINPEPELSLKLAIKHLGYTEVEVPNMDIFLIRADL
jgi:hypothetical protein